MVFIGIALFIIGFLAGRRSQQLNVIVAKSETIKAMEDYLKLQRIIEKFIQGEPK